MRDGPKQLTTDSPNGRMTATWLRVGGLPLFSPVINAVDTLSTPSRGQTAIFVLFFFQKLPHLELIGWKERKVHAYIYIYIRSVFVNFSRRWDESWKVLSVFSARPRKISDDPNTCRAITEWTRVCCFNALRNNKPPPSRSQCFAGAKEMRRIRGWVTSEKHSKNYSKWSRAHGE